MDSVNVEAVTRLKSTILGLLPTPSAVEFTSDILIIQADINPAGISGIIGFSVDPIGEIQGRHVKASMIITVKSATPEELSSNVKNSIETLLSFGKGELRQQGLLKLSIEKPIVTKGIPPSDITIKVFYEYQKHPEISEGIIESIPINMS